MKHGQSVVERQGIHLSVFGTIFLKEKEALNGRYKMIFLHFDLR